MPRTAAGKNDPGIPAVIAHRLVHENAVVVRVETEQFERQPPADLAQHLPEQGLFAVQKRRALGPSRGDVGDSTFLIPMLPVRSPWGAFQMRQRTEPGERFR